MQLTAKEHQRAIALVITGAQRLRHFRSHWGPAAPPQYNPRAALPAPTWYRERCADLSPGNRKVLIASYGKIDKEDRGTFPLIDFALPGETNEALDDAMQADVDNCRAAAISPKCAKLIALHVKLFDDARRENVIAYLETRKARGAKPAPAPDLTPAPTPVPADGASETVVAGETGEWVDFLAGKLGTSKWIVAGRLSAKMKAKGYEKAISPRKFDLLEAEWRAAGMKQDASRERTTMTSNNAAARRRRINAYLAKRTTHKTASPIVVAQETALTPLPADAPPLPSDGAGAPLTWLDRLDDEIHDRTRQETTNYWLAQVPANAGGVPIDAREHFELAAIAAEDARHDPRVAKLAAMFERRSEIERYRAVRAFVGTKYDVPPGMPFRDPLALAVWVIERLPVALAA